MNWKKIRQREWHRLLDIESEMFLVRYNGIIYLARKELVQTKCKKSSYCEKSHYHPKNEVIKMIGFSNPYNNKITNARLDSIIKPNIRKGNHCHIEYKFLDSAVTPEAILAKACKCHSTHVSYEERLHEALYGKFHDEECGCEYTEDFLKSVPQGRRMDFY